MAEIFDKSLYTCTSVVVLSCCVIDLEAEAYDKPADKKAVLKTQKSVQHVVKHKKTEDGKVGCFQTLMVL